MYKKGNTSLTLAHRTLSYKDPLAVRTSICTRASRFSASKRSMRALAAWRSISDSRRSAVWLADSRCNSRVSFCTSSFARVKASLHKSVYLYLLSAMFGAIYICIVLICSDQPSFEHTCLMVPQNHRQFGCFWRNNPTSELDTLVLQFHTRYCDTNLEVSRDLRSASISSRSL